MHFFIVNMEWEWAWGRGCSPWYQIYYIPFPVQVVDLLLSSFHCLSKLSQEAVVRNCSPSPSTSKDTRGPLLASVTTETVLRLTNHCWEQLSEVRSYNNKYHTYTACAGWIHAPSLKSCVTSCHDSCDMPCFSVIGLLTANESRTIICTNGIWFNVPLYRFLIGMADHHSLGSRRCQIKYYVYIMNDIE